MISVRPRPGGTVACAASPGRTVGRPRHRDVLHPRRETADVVAAERGRGRVAVLAAVPRLVPGTVVLAAVPRVVPGAGVEPGRAVAIVRAVAHVRLRTARGGDR